MEEKKTDRRVKRTRNLLLGSMIQLLEEKDLKDITVKEITDLADLNRGTFYLHYKDVFSMMEDIQKELFERLRSILTEFAPNGKNDTPYNVLYHCFVFLLEEKQLAKVLMGPHGDYQFIASLKQILREHIVEVWLVNNYETENFEYFYSYCISGILGLIQYWLESDSVKSPKDMADLVNDFVTNEIRLFERQ